MSTFWRKNSKNHSAKRAGGRVSQVPVVIFRKTIRFVTGPVEEAVAVGALHDDFVALELDEFLWGNIEMADLADAVLHGSYGNACLLHEQKVGAPEEVGLQFHFHLFLAGLQAFELFLRAAPFPYEAPGSPTPASRAFLRDLSPVPGLQHPESQFSPSPRGLPTLWRKFLSCSRRSL